MSHIYLLHQIHPCHIFWILKFRHRGKLYFHFLLQLLQILLHHRHVVAQRGRLVDQVLLDVLGVDCLPDPESFPEENGRRHLFRPLEDPLRGENRNFRIPGRHLLVMSTSKYQRHSICLSGHLLPLLSPTSILLRPTLGLLRRHCLISLCLLEGVDFSSTVPRLTGRGGMPRLKSNLDAAQQAVIRSNLKI